MTNKNVIASLILAALSSFQVLAIENGTSVDWQNDFDDQVKNNCTGMIVGGNQVLTAAHCTDLTSITFADGTVMDAVSRDDHPSYLYSSSGSQYD
ncbi:trypsin-like serine protease, partial [Vibrio splendidus]|uniref:trypsin-like serine protease n=1 Tax=Vibrio splendidus TaxID=29497 RepID=UPI00049439C4